MRTSNNVLSFVSERELVGLLNCVSFILDRMDSYIRQE